MIYKQRDVMNNPWDHGAVSIKPDVSYYTMKKFPSESFLSGGKKKNYDHSMRKIIRENGWRKKRITAVFRIIHERSNPGPAPPADHPPVCDNWDNNEKPLQDETVSPVGLR